MRKIHYLLTLALCAGVATVSATGCELIASVDRTLIGAGGGSGGAGGSGGGTGGSTTSGGGGGQGGQGGQGTGGSGCGDMLQNGSETDVDCGGTDCPVCAQGKLCGAGTDCESTFCTDGVCCATACDGTCQACNNAGTEGTCGVAPSGTTEPGCMDSMACDGAGLCKGQLGAACAQGAQCLSGFCADGVCCNSDCAGTCEACNIVITSGTCTMVADGMDPDSECATQAASTCGTSGTCNGAGACALHPAGTSCSTSSCSAGVQTNADTCDGIGTCTDNGTTNCSPYVCGLLTCKMSCVVDVDCAAGFTCTNSMCQ